MKLRYAPGACSLAPHIVIAEAGLDVALDLSGAAKLEAYFQRVQARPGVQKALAEEGLPTS